MKFRIPNRKACITWLSIWICFSAAAQDTLRVTIYFESGVHALQVAQQEQLLALANTLSEATVGTLKVSAYCDATGTSSHNMLLSQSRLAAVVAYLRAHIDTTRMLLSGNAYGESSPVGDNATPEGRSLNRRVEIIAIVSHATRSQSNALRPGQIKLPIPEFSLTQPKSLREAILELKPGENLVLRDIQFPLASDTLLPETFGILDSLVSVLQQYPDMRIQFEGHVCCTSNTGMVAGHADAYNARTHRYHLSADRAFAVYAYMRAKGIDAHRIKYAGFSGTKKLIDPEFTEQDQQLNRRVEIKLLAK